MERQRRIFTQSYLNAVESKLQSLMSPFDLAGLLLCLYCTFSKIFKRYVVCVVERQYRIFFQGASFLPNVVQSKLQFLMFPLDLTRLLLHLYCTF